jgi:hypothetical protein
MTATVAPVTAAAVKYGDDRAADQAALMQPQIDQLIAQRDALLAEHNTDTATIADLQQQLADCQAVQPQPPKPPPLSMLIGLRSDVSPMATAVSTFGKDGTEVTRLFEQGLPATSDVKSQAWGTHWVAGQVPIVSYKSSGGNLATYIKSIVGVNGQMAYHHEPEADYGTDGIAGGAKFVAEFVKEYDVAHAAAPGVPFGMIAGAYQYRRNGLGATGSFLPPANKVDFYALDTYLTGGTGVNAIQPLETEPRFQTWYNLVKGRGKPLYITEYGRGLVTDKTQDPLRADVIAKDRAYLGKIGVKAWVYWWTADGAIATSGKDWQFKDTGSINAWKAAAEA